MQASSDHILFNVTHLKADAMCNTSYPLIKSYLADRTLNGGGLCSDFINSAVFILVSFAAASELWTGALETPVCASDIQFQAIYHVYRMRCSSRTPSPRRMCTKDFLFNLISPTCPGIKLFIQNIVYWIFYWQKAKGRDPAWNKDACEYREFNKKIYLPRTKG